MSISFLLDFLFPACKGVVFTEVVAKVFSPCQYLGANFFPYPISEVFVLPQSLTDCSLFDCVFFCLLFSALFRHSLCFVPNAP